MPVTAHKFAGKGAAAEMDSSGNVAIMASAADGENAKTVPESADPSASLLGLAFSQSAALVVVVTQPLLSVTAATLLLAKPHRVAF